MTHTYALKRLLEHGPLTHSELLDITKWKPVTLKATLQRLDEAEILAKQPNPGKLDRVIYGLYA